MWLCTRRYVSLILIIPSSSNSPDTKMAENFYPFGEFRCSFLPSLVYIISALIAVQIGEKEPIKKAWKIARNQ